MNGYPIITIIKWNAYFKTKQTAARSSSTNVVIVQDTDVTITGVYVNASQHGTSQEASYCKMQYRVQSSVTEERLVLASSSSGTGNAQSQQQSNNNGSAVAASTSVVSVTDAKSSMATTSAAVSTAVQSVASVSASSVAATGALPTASPKYTPLSALSCMLPPGSADSGSLGE